MANYLRPGVYVEEYLNPLSDVTSDPSESSAAFVGRSTGGGPIGPTLVTTWNQYQGLFGGIAQVNDALAYAVYSFFANGGNGCYVVRAVNDDATSATLSISGTQTVPAPVLKVDASAPGTWASAATSSSRVYVTVQPSTGAGRFDLIVEVGTGAYLAVREQFTSLTMNPLDPRYAVDIVNSTTVGSKFVNLTNLVAATPYDSTLNPASATKVPLTGGTEGTGTPNLVTATQRLETVDKNFVINVPAASAVDVTDVVNWAASTGRHFVVADVPDPAPNESAAASATAQATFADAVPNSSHVAVYGPWIHMVDPGSRAGATRVTAPGGAVVGQFLRTDVTRGVHKAPAGTQTGLVGAVAPLHNFTNAQQDTLYTAGVNLIKTVPGAGICIMGSRTQGTGFPDRYIPVRRLLIAVKSSLEAITRFALFENNDSDLWETIEDVVGTYLNQQFDLGAFKGDSPDQAFYVRCDESNNTPADADAGVINVEVGVALKNPAEFIVIRLGQSTAGATATDSLEDE